MENHCASGYGDYQVYQDDHDDAVDRAIFDRYNRIASCMVDFLAGRGVDPDNYYVREAAHWQIWFMRQKGSVQACFSDKPIKESFADYSVQRSTDTNGKIRLFGMDVCPMMIQLLRAGGIISSWV